MKIDRIAVFKKCGGRCGYCGQLLEFKKMQVDHMEPKYLAHMTPDIDPNRFENLLPTCRKCNHYKRASTIEQFRRDMTTLHERLHKIYIFEVATNFGIVTTKQFEGKFYFETL